MHLSSKVGNRGLIPAKILSPYVLKVTGIVPTLLITVPSFWYPELSIWKIWLLELPLFFKFSDSSRKRVGLILSTILNKGEAVVSEAHTGFAINGFITVIKVVFPEPLLPCIHIYGIRLNKSVQ